MLLSNTMLKLLVSTFCSCDFKYCVSLLLLLLLSLLLQYAAIAVTAVVTCVFALVLVVDSDDCGNIY